MDEKKLIEEMATAICDECRAHTPNCEYIICDSAIESAEAVFAAGYRKRSGWISVDERLPRLGETVLVRCKGISTKGFTVVSEMMESNGERWTATAGFVVTHWMPLPEPPKGE